MIMIITCYRVSQTTGQVLEKIKLLFIRRQYIRRPGHQVHHVNNASGKLSPLLSKLIMPGKKKNYTWTPMNFYAVRGMESNISYYTLVWSTQYLMLQVKFFLKISVNQNCIDYMSLTPALLPFLCWLGHIGIQDGITVDHILAVGSNLTGRMFAAELCRDQAQINKKGTYKMKDMVQLKIITEKKWRVILKPRM